MAKPLEVKPKFYMPYDVLLEKGKILFECAEKDLDGLYNYDPDYNNEYLKRFKSAITEAEQLPSDLRIKNLLDQLSLKLESEMSSCKEISRKIRQALSEVFPENSEKLNEWGFEEYDLARKNHEQMVQLMKTLSEKISGLERILSDKGFTDEFISNIEYHYRLLRQAHQEYSLFIKSLGITKKRKVIKLNTIWNFVKGVSYAGKMAFSTDYSKYKQYILMDDDGRRELNFNGKVAPGHSLLLYDKEISPTWIFTLRNISDAPLLFSLTDKTSSNNNEGVIIEENNTIITNSTELGQGRFLKVTNKSNETEGIYEVSVN